MKLLTYLISITALLALWACTEDPYSPDVIENAPFKVTEEKNSLKPLFYITRDYKMFLKLTLPSETYDSITVKAQRLKNPAIIFTFRDDGIAPDLIHGNGIWTAGFTPASIDTAYNDSIKITATMYYQGKSTISSFKKAFRVKHPEMPILDSIFIDSLKTGDSLKAGFAAFAVGANLRDGDNRFGYFDTLTYHLKISNSLNMVVKDFTTRTLTYSKLDTCRFKFNALPTLASGIPTGVNYKIEAYIVDQFDHTVPANPLTFNNIYIENTPPVISSLTAPDTLRIPSDNSTIFFKVTVKVADLQGFSFTDDLKELNLILNNSLPFKMNDSGKNGDVTANDGIFSYQFYYTAAQPEGIVNWSVFAKDKVNQVSDTLSRSSLFYKPKKIKG